MAWKGYPDIMLGEIPMEPSFGLVPATPGIQIIPNDIDTMCVGYVPDTVLEIRFYPKPEFGKNLIQLAEDTLAEKGAAIPFLFITEDRNLLGRWGATQRSLDDFREHEAMFRSEFSKNLLHHFTIVFPAMQYRHSIEMLNKWAPKVEKPLRVCPEPVIKEAEVWDYIDSHSFDGQSAKLFRKDKPAPDRTLYSVE